MGLGLRVTLTAADAPSMNLLMVYLNNKLLKIGALERGRFEQHQEVNDLYKGDWTVYPRDVAAAMLLLDEEVLMAPMADSDKELWDLCMIRDLRYTLVPAQHQGDVPFSTFMDVVSYTQERASATQVEMVTMMGEIVKLKEQQKRTIDTIKVINETVSAMHAKWEWLTKNVGISNWPTVLKNIVNEITLLGGSDIDLEPVNKKPKTH